MKLRVAWIGKTKESAIQTLSAEYLRRLARYVATEGIELPNEDALVKLTERGGRRQSNSQKLVSTPLPI